jgi:exosortase/archaeosortase family protein
MTVSPSAGGSSRPRPPWQMFGYSLLVLFAGFVLLEAPPVAAFFELVTEALAAAAIVPLKLAGFDMTRNGVELRDNLSGHAVAVTSACDGSGLIVSYLGLVALFGGRTNSLARPLAAFLIAVVVILTFNVVRIGLLFLSIGLPWLMTAAHMFAAPLLSSVLVAALGFQALGMAPDRIVRDVLVWLGFGVLAATAWYFIADAASCLASVPLANAMLFLLPVGVSDTISCSSADSLVITMALQSLRPPTFVTTPFYPSDFTLAMPLVAASLALRREMPAALKGVLVSVLLFSLAMSLGALTAGYDEVSETRATMLSSGGIVSNYRLPPSYWIATLKAAQNMLVHFNLFVLPFAIAFAPRASENSRLPDPPRANTGRTRRRRRR